MTFTWVCDIPGADAPPSAWHFALHVGLAAFVVGAGIVFLALALIADRRSAPIAGHAGAPATD